mmetsp:Transcript_47963/g.110311  ORF Transcript_47963/g.110311 Transcript_47963/m.110311 type:complete len:245 (+) Transcript_47963:1142-1876(+)
MPLEMCFLQYVLHMGAHQFWYVTPHQPSTAFAYGRWVRCTRACAAATFCECAVLRPRHHGAQASELRRSRFSCLPGGGGVAASCRPRSALRTSAAASRPRAAALRPRAAAAAADAVAAAVVGGASRPRARFALGASTAALRRAFSARSWPTSARSSSALIDSSGRSGSRASFVPAPGPALDQSMSSAMSSGHVVVLARSADEERGAQGEAAREERHEQREHDHAPDAHVRRRALWADCEEREER